MSDGYFFNREVIPGVASVRPPLPSCPVHFQDPPKGFNFTLRKARYSSIGKLRAPGPVHMHPQRMQLAPAAPHTSKPSMNTIPRIAHLRMVMCIDVEGPRPYFTSLTLTAAGPFSPFSTSKLTVLPSMISSWNSFTWTNTLSWVSESLINP